MTERPYEAGDPRAFADVQAEQQRQTQQDAAAGLDGLTVEQLRDEARARGLAVSGTKAELLERLRGGPVDQQAATTADVSTADDDLQVEDTSSE